MADLTHGESLVDTIVRLFGKDSSPLTNALYDRLTEKRVPVSKLIVVYVRDAVFQIQCQILAIDGEQRKPIDLSVCFDGCHTKDDIFKSLDNVAEEIRNRHQERRLMDYFVECALRPSASLLNLIK